MSLLIFIKKHYNLIQSKMVKLNEIYVSLQNEGLYDKYFDLYVSDKPGDKEIELLERRLKKNGKEDLLTPNSVFVFGKSNIDIPFNSKFDVMFLSSDPEKFMQVNATLKYANAHPSYESEVVPKGHTGVVCLIEFDKNIPKEIFELTVYKQQEWDKSKTLYLTQKKVLDRILELTKKGVS